MKILLIEDNLDIIKSLTYLLSSNNYLVVSKTTLKDSIPDMTAEELKPMTYANKEEEATQEVASDSVEEVKEVVEPTEEEIEQACAELTE